MGKISRDDIDDAIEVLRAHNNKDKSTEAVTAGGPLSPLKVIVSVTIADVVA
jgi:hypothetical protein